MSLFTYHFKVVDKARGGLLEDRGCAVNAGDPQLGLATMGGRDRLSVAIEWEGLPNDAPESMAGHFVLSPAVDAPSTQVAPSPFRDLRNYRCYWMETAQKTAAASGAIYTFAGREIDASARGKYELTFVAETDRGLSTATQWSVDPEFDTGS